MHKTIVSLLLSITMLNTPLVVDAEFHTHGSIIKSYITTHQDGMYTHPYITGVNPITGTITYGKCRVMCEIEYYKYEYTCCSAKYGNSYPVPTESHGSCWQ